MIKFYINIRQLHNFVDLKEPVQFYNFSVDDRLLEFYMDPKQVIIKDYGNHYTIELNTRKKRRKALWQKIKKKFIHKKN